MEDIVSRQNMFHFLLWTPRRLCFEVQPDLLYTCGFHTYNSIILEVRIFSGFRGSFLTLSKRFQTQRESGVYNFVENQGKETLHLFSIVSRNSFFYLNIQGPYVNCRLNMF